MPRSTIVQQARADLALMVVASEPACARDRLTALRPEEGVTFGRLPAACRRSCQSAVDGIDHGRTGDPLLLVKGGASLECGIPHRWTSVIPQRHGNVHDRLDVIVLWGDGSGFQSRLFQDLLAVSGRLPRTVTRSGQRHASASASSRRRTACADGSGSWSSPVAGLGEPEVAFDDQEWVLHLRAHRGLP